MCAQKLDHFDIDIHFARFLFIFSFQPLFYIIQSFYTHIFNNLLAFTSSLLILSHLLLSIFFLFPFTFSLSLVLFFAICSYLSLISLTLFCSTLLLNIISSLYYFWIIQRGYHKRKVSTYQSLVALYNSWRALCESIRVHFRKSKRRPFFRALTRVGITRSS